MCAVYLVICVQDAHLEARGLCQVVSTADLQFIFQDRVCGSWESPNSVSLGDPPASPPQCSNNRDMLLHSTFNVSAGDHNTVSVHVWQVLYQLRHISKPQEISISQICMLMYVTFLEILKRLNHSKN